MCECVQQFNEQMEQYNTRISVAFFADMKTGRLTRTPPLVATEKLDSSKRGRAKKVAASHCPFCGEHYETGSSLTKERDELKAVLSQIANDFMTPEEIRDEDIGLPYEEHLEMSYENIQAVAREALVPRIEVEDDH